MPRNKYLYGVSLMVMIAGVTLAIYNFSSLQTTGLAQVPNKMTPLTATYTINRFSSSDTLPTSTETRGFAVRSDGSSVELFFRPDPAGSSKLTTMSVITDVSTRRTVNLVQFGKWKTTYPLAEQQINSVAKRPIPTALVSPRGSYLASKS